jgi:beta-fructofuranosidase
MQYQFHFAPKKGWLNDPNGLIFFRERYHAFFQHNPYGVTCENMHWGHAVSDDLLHWAELPPALAPDSPYETIGCWSGGAVERDGALYLFYTANSREFGQTQCMARSTDGVTFEKYAGNPLVAAAPPDGSADFRDPCVRKTGGRWRMVCGSGKNGAGRALLFGADNLTDWRYEGVLFETADCEILECPDFFETSDGRFALLFSKIFQEENGTAFAVGGFDGRRLTAARVFSPEFGPDFYAPQSFLDGQGRRIVIGWASAWTKKVPENAERAGAFSIPRELTFAPDGSPRLYPVAEARRFLAESDPAVTFSKTALRARLDGGERTFDCGEIREAALLRDGDLLEIFINGGERSFTFAGVP